MILSHKTGVLLHGTLTKDPLIKDVGKRQVLKFDIKAHSVKNDAGKWESLYVQVNVWNGIEQWDGMLQKGDSVTVFARKLDSRDYNGKTYYSVDADDVQPGGLVIFRWMQSMLQIMEDMIPSAPPEMQPTDEPTPFDPPPEPAPMQTTLQGAQIYPGERLSDYAPRNTQPPTPEADALIDEDAADLPF